MNTFALADLGQYGSDSEESCDGDRNNGICLAESDPEKHKDTATATISDFSSTEESATKLVNAAAVSCSFGEADKSSFVAEPFRTFEDIDTKAAIIRKRITGGASEEPQAFLPNEAAIKSVTSYIGKFSTSSVNLTEVKDVIRNEIIKYKKPFYFKRLSLLHLTYISCE